MKALTRLAVTATAVAGALVLGLTLASASPSAPSPAVPAGSGRVLTAAVQLPQSQPETLFRTVAPCRVADTRVIGGALGNGTARSYVVGGTTGFAPQGGTPGGCGIPSGATAVAAVVTAVTSSGGGYFKAWPAGSAPPNSSILNYTGHAATGTGVTLALRSGGGQGVSISNNGGPAHVVIDVQGYYIPQIQALIGGGGVISAGTPRVLSVSHPGTGFYSITLDRPARECSPSAATYNLYRYASVGLSSASTPNVISVSIWNLDPTTHKATQEDYSFFLTVTC